MGNNATFDSLYGLGLVSKVEYCSAASYGADPADEGEGLAESKVDGRVASQRFVNRLFARKAKGRGNRRAGA
jgi:hypothetical protein